MADIEVSNRKYTAQELVDIFNIYQKNFVKDASFQKNDPFSSTINSNPLYGPYQDGSGYGTFSYPGMRPGMFSSFQRPRSLVRLLGVTQSLIANEKIGIMTGVTDVNGTNATDFCAEPIRAGQLKRCVQNYIWGKWSMETNLNSIAEMGEYVDYADTNKSLMNLANSDSPFIPEIARSLDIENRNGLQLRNEFWNIGVALERYLEKVIVQGNETTAPASTQAGFIKEFKGLERQITTGKADLDTGRLCEGADSQLLTWGTGIDQSSNSRTFPQMLVDFMFWLRDKAEQVGMGGTEFVIVMPTQMFRALTYVWACQYYTSRCAGTAGNPGFTNQETITRIQLEMLNGNYLLIDGIPVPVVFSDGIPETRASNTVWTAGEMFILPTMWNGMNLLNLQFKPMNNADAVAFANAFGTPAVDFQNNGMFLVAKLIRAACMQYVLQSKFRLIQEAPFLAAKISTVQYTYTNPYISSAYPGDTIRHSDGGVTRWDGNYTVTGG